MFLKNMLIPLSGSMFFTAVIVQIADYALRHEDPCLLDPGISWKRVVSFTPQPLYSRGKSSITHWIGSLDDPTTGLDDTENRQFLTLQGLELRSLSRPARNQSLYRLCYPGS
jgi:hypothetical protein